jgi:hypothetical protein
MCYKTLNFFSINVNGKSFASFQKNKYRVAWTGRYVDLIQSPVPGAQVLFSRPNDDKIPPMLQPPTSVLEANLQFLLDLGPHADMHTVRSDMSSDP